MMLMYIRLLIVPASYRCFWKSPEQRERAASIKCHDEGRNNHRGKCAFLTPLSLAATGGPPHRLCRRGLRACRTPCLAL
eukprot:1155586-Amorphochlora_amoeboformis.AAC.1